MRPFKIGTMAIAAILAAGGANQVQAQGVEGADAEVTEVDASEAEAVDASEEEAFESSEEEAFESSEEEASEDLGDVPQDDFIPEEGFVPDEGLEQYVSVSSKRTQTVEEAAASVYVISRTEIEAAGYSSVGEALSFVPGLFTSFDLVNFHVGVRGIFGGSRSGSRTLKVLIDGRPVTVVQSGTYLLGAEFVPISAIERIEIMRGPASALYGAGALEGAINVVTKRPPFEGETTFGGQAIASGGALGQVGGGIDATGIITGERAMVLLSYSGARTDRSGLSIPEESEFSDNSRFMNGTRQLTSRNDIAKPQVFLAKVQATVGDGRLDARFIMQMTDAGAEFHDLSVLSGESRVNLYNANAAISYEKPFSSGFSLKVAGGFTNSAPLGDDKISNSSTSLPVGLVSLGSVAYEREYSSEEFTGSVELLREFSEGGLVTVGADFSNDVENLSRVTEIDPMSNMVLNERAAPGEVTLGNYGTYAQLLYPVTSKLSIAAGSRYDYTTNPDGSDLIVQDASYSAVTGRLATVLRPVDRLSIKAMLGRAYKLASPEQRFARAIRSGDFAGQENLRPQFINSAELSASVFASKTFKTTITGYVNQHQDALSNILFSGALVAASFDSTTAGGEFSAHYSAHFESGSSLNISSAISVQDTKTKEAFVDALVIKPVPDNEIFPRFMWFTKAHMQFPDANLAMFLAHRHIGERVPSQSNSLAAGTVRVGGEDYRLAAFDVIDLGVATMPIDIGDNRKLVGSVKVQNLLDNKYSEIGFNGVDVPTIGRVVWGRVRLDL